MRFAAPIDGQSLSNFGGRNMRQKNTNQACEMLTVEEALNPLEFWV
jgi:hypothetical protein